MKLTHAIDLYIADMRAEGRINSARTEQSYWEVLELHARDSGNRDPRTINREDVRRTLARWPNPNTRRTRHAVLTSFYDWCVEEGLMPASPARQVRRSKARPTSVYRLTVDEVHRMLEACDTDLEHRIVRLGLYSGLRVQELRGLQGRHFARMGWVHVSADIAKGGKERWVPVLEGLRPVVDDLDVGLAEFVLPSQHVGLHGKERQYVRRSFPDKQMGAVTIWRAVRRVSERAGIVGNVGPHTLRHAFCDLVTRGSSIHVAQALMGHSDIGTTEGYAGAPTMDELRTATLGVRYPPSGTSENPVMETVGIEPTIPAPFDSVTGETETDGV